jgi:hypothetical protein
MFFDLGIDRFTSDDHGIRVLYGRFD